MMINSEIIECIDEVKVNPHDHAGITFVIKDDINETIKWCRRNFGNRGDGWDFIAGKKHVQLTIWSKRLITMWMLWQE